jgi:hypothetical protein
MSTNYTNAVRRANWNKHGERLSVLDFGAERGRIVTDAAVTASSPVDYTLTSATAAFTSDDVGSLVVVEGAGADGTYLSSTIQSVTDPTSVELADAPGTTVTGATVGIGPDCTSAFNNALAASNDYLVIPWGVFMLNGKITLGSNSRIIGESRSGTILFNGSDDFTFELLTELATPANTKTPLITGMRFENFTLYAKNGIKLNREWEDITNPENPESDWDKQRFILGVVLKQLYFRGEYNSDLDANFETDTAPTLAELRGYGIGFHANKLFDSEIKLCDFRLYGIGTLTTGCDINELMTTRYNENARHWHSKQVTVTGVDVIGSSNVLHHCDMLVNYRIGGIYLDTTNGHIIRDCFFENPATSRDSTNYLITTNDIYTKIVGNRFSTTKGSGSGTSTPYMDLDPRWGLEVAHNSWNVGVGGVPESSAQITNTSWSSSLLRHVRFIDNDPEMPLPDAPLQEEAYDGYRLYYRNWFGISGILATYPFIQSGTTGRWVFQSSSGLLVWRTPLKNPHHRRLLFEYWARKITAGGTQAAFYLEDVGTCTAEPSTDVITCTAHGQSNDDRVQFRTTGVLPAGLVLGTNYWVVNASPPDELKVSLTQGGAAVDITDAGTGTHYIRHRDELYNQTHGHDDTTKATYFRHTGRIPAARRGDGDFELLFTNQLAELESIEITPVDYELAASIPTDSDHDIGDVVFNTAPEKVEAYGWVYDNTSTWVPVARFGNGIGYEYISASATLDDVIHMIGVDTTTGDITLTLVDASGVSRVGMWYLIQNVTGGNSVILDAAGTDDINGAGTFTLSDDDDLALLMCFGAGKWKAHRIGEQQFWTAISADEIGTEFQVTLTDTSNSRPMQLSVVDNAHASQPTTPLVDAGKLKAYRDWVGVNQSVRSGSEVLGVTGLSRLNGALELPTLTALRACYTDGSKNLISSTVTNVELAYLAGVTSAIQTQLADRYTKAEVDALLANKLATSVHDAHQHTGTADIDISISGTTTGGPGHEHSFADTDSDSDGFTTSTPI